MRPNIEELVTTLSYMGGLSAVSGMIRQPRQSSLLEQWGVQGRLGNLDVIELLSRGLGNRLAFHIYDGSPVVDVDLSAVPELPLGLLAMTARAPQPSGLIWAFLGLSLAARVYLHVSVKDTEVVDRFLAALDSALAKDLPSQRPYFIRPDSYRLDWKQAM